MTGGKCSEEMARYLHFEVLEPGTPLTHVLNELEEMDGNERADFNDDIEEPFDLDAIQGELEEIVETYGKEITVGDFVQLED